MFKGYCIGDVGSGGIKVDLLNSLGAYCYVAGPWSYYRAPAPPLERLAGEWFVWLAEGVPSADEVRRVYAAKGEKVAWQLGNEPDDLIYGRTPEYVAQQTIAQVNLLRSVNPYARMYMSMGHQVSAFKNTWGRPCWMDRVWPLLIESDKGLSPGAQIIPALTGFHAHVYVEMEKTVPMGEWYLNPSFAETLIGRNLRWMRRNKLSHLAFRLSEFGWSMGLERGEAIAAMVHLRQSVPTGTEGVVIYAAQRSEEDEGDSRGYTLLTRDGDLTLVGRVFQDLDPDGMNASRAGPVTLEGIKERAARRTLGEREGGAD